MNRIRLPAFYVASMVWHGKRSNVKAVGIGIYVPSDNEDMKMTLAEIRLLARHIQSTPKIYWTNTGFVEGSLIIERVTYTKCRISISQLLGAPK